MSQLALRAYHFLPPFARTLAATVHGYTLRQWRYGPDTDELADEALRRERWEPDRFRSWQEDRLARLLHTAAMRVPYYRNQWAERRRRGDRADVEVLENWPILAKEQVRHHPAAFLVEGCDPRSMYKDHTSGTTGTPLTLWLTRETVRSWYALYEARTRRWHGVTRHDRWGLLGGQPVVRPGQRSAPFWVWNGGLNQLYLSAMHIAPWSERAYLEAIRKYELRYLIGYPSSLSYLAQAAEASGTLLPNLTAVVTNAEPLYDQQRQAILRGFHCRLQETYGMAEIVCAASECEHGAMHLWPEAGVVEIVDDEGRMVPDGTPGRIVATGILNTEMPLVRYDTRDRGQLKGDRTPCACSRSLPVLEKVWGRYDDQIVTADGRRPVLLDRIFDPPVHVREGQIIQEAIGRFRIRVVPTGGWSDADRGLLSRSLAAIVGEADITIELVESIERTWAGKFRIIISQVGKARS